MIGAVDPSRIGDIEPAAPVHLATIEATASWPPEGTFHSLRHYFATMLITAGADPTDVQRALRHSSLRITLETYVHWWPRKQRRRNIIGSQLRPATTRTDHQDQE